MEGIGSTIDTDAKKQATVVPSSVGLTEILPRQGLVYSEVEFLAERLCKPRVMPIKSVTLEKLEQMEKESARFKNAKESATQPETV